MRLILIFLLLISIASADSVKLDNYAVEILNWQKPTDENLFMIMKPHYLNYTDSTSIIQGFKWRGNPDAPPDCLFLIKSYDKQVPMKLYANFGRDMLHAYWNSSLPEESSGEPVKRPYPGYVTHDAVGPGCITGYMAQLDDETYVVMILFDLPVKARSYVNLLKVNKL